MCSGSLVGAACSYWHLLGAARGYSHSLGVQIVLGAFRGCGSLLGCFASAHLDISAPSGCSMNVLGVFLPRSSSSAKGSFLAFRASSGFVLVLSVGDFLFARFDF